MFHCLNAKLQSMDFECLEYDGALEYMVFSCALLALYFLGPTPFPSNITFQQCLSWIDFYIMAVNLFPIKQILEEIRSDYVRSKIIEKPFQNLISFNKPTH